MWFSTVKYTDYGGKMMTTLHFVWELDEEFEGIRDYQTLGNKLIEEGELPRWRSIPCTLQEDARRYELQLIPVNYIISLWKRGPWDEYTHLPSKVLDLCFSILQCPPDNIIQLISLQHELHHKKFETIMTRFRHRYRTRIDQNQQDEDHIIFTKAIPN